MIKPESKEYPIGAKIAGWFILLPSFAAVFYWWNHVLYWHQLTYMQWLVVGTGYTLAFSLFKPLKYINGMILATCIVAQCLAWVGAIALPLIRP